MQGEVEVVNPVDHLPAVKNLEIISSAKADDVEIDCDPIANISSTSPEIFITDDNIVNTQGSIGAENECAGVEKGDIVMDSANMVTSQSLHYGRFCESCRKNCGFDRPWR